MLAPKLFPFFRHTIANVRLAVVQTLHAFMMVSSLPRGWITVSFLRLLFQNLLVEERTDIRNATLSAWRLVLDILGTTGSWLESLIDQQLLLDWYASLMTPLGLPLDVSTFFDPILEADRTGIAERHNVDKNMVAQDMSLVTPETVLRARVAAATALAYVTVVWPAYVGLFRVLRYLPDTD